MLVFYTKKTKKPKQNFKTSQKQWWGLVKPTTVIISSILAVTPPPGIQVYSIIFYYNSNLYEWQLCVIKTHSI